MIKKITIVAGICIIFLATACKTSAIKMNTKNKEWVGMTDDENSEDPMFAYTEKNT